MDYASALDYLAGFSRFGMRLDLDRMRELLHRLGDPQEQLAFIHVAGTNGKGSTSAMLESVLRAAGYRTGLYTSPHLQRFTERVQVDGREIAQADVTRHLDAIRPVIDGMLAAGLESPTEFEVITALALRHFLAVGVDAVVLEVGLGGRYDATNVISRPLLTVITHIHFDHTDRLGHTLEAIAGEKAGIIKAGRPVITSAGEPEAVAVIERVAAEHGAPLQVVGRDIRWHEVSCGQDGQVLDMTGPGWRYESLRLPLVGRHQQANAATAVAALTALAAEGLPVPEAALRQGLAAVRWPGRLEVVRRSPLVVLDGAHNPDGARAAAAAVRDVLPHRRVVLLLGMLFDKPMDQVLGQLLPIANQVIVTEPVLGANQRHAAVRSAVELAARISRQGMPAVAEPDPVRALDMALGQTGPEDLLLLTGSLYLVGALRGRLVGKEDPV